MFKNCLPRKLNTVSCVVAAAIFFAANSASAAPMATVRSSVSSVVPSVAEGYAGETPTFVRVRKLDVPKYPQHLVDTGVEGTIAVRADVDAEGEVTAATIAFSNSPAILAMQDRVLQSVRKAKFYPASLAGKPTPVAVIVPFQFEIVDEVVSMFPFKRVARSVGAQS